MAYDIVDIRADDNTVEARLGGSMPSFNNIVAPMKGDVEHSIKTWLARPYKYLSFKFKTTDLANGELVTLALFSDLMAKPYYKDKLSGFFGLRATVHVRLQVNANRFQAGRLMLHYCPAAVYSVTHENLQRSLTSRTQLPRVDLDVNTDSEVTMTVPYTSSSPFYAFGTETFAGHVGVTTYSPLNVGTSETDCDCALFVHLTDVELFWPSFVTPQSGFTGGRLKNRERNETEEQWADHKPVSSSLVKVSKVFDVLSDIPLVSSYMAPLSWSSRILANVASAMGYCKPISHKADRVAISYLNNMGTGTGYDYSQPMSLLEDNAVSVLSGLGGSDLDHMSLRYPLSIPTYFNGRSWSVSAQSGAVLFSSGCAPTDYDNYQGTGVWQTTPISFLGQLFAYWRGSINITIKFVKTEFHTGRLRFWYSPRGIPNATQSEENYLYSSIIDLKYSNEVTFTVPYMGSTLYSRTTNNDARWGLTIVNELRAPDNVNNAVYVLFEVSAGKDFELAVPRSDGVTYPTTLFFGSGTPTFPGTAASPLIINSVTGQAGDNSLVSLQGNYQDHPVANAPLTVASLEPSKAAIGERITSVKQLISRSTSMMQIYNAAQTTYLNVDAPGCHNVNSTGLSTTLGNQTLFGVIRDCYAFYRGSVNVKVACQDINYPLDILSFTAVTNYTTAVNSDANFCSPPFRGIYQQACPGVVKPAGQDAVELRIPNYSNDPTYRPVFSTQQVQSGFTKNSRIVSFQKYSHNGDFVARVFLSAGDDMQLGLWVTSPLKLIDKPQPAPSDKFYWYGT